MLLNLPAHRQWNLQIHLVLALALSHDTLTMPSCKEGLGLLEQRQGGTGCSQLSSLPSLPQATTTCACAARATCRSPCPPSSCSWRSRTTCRMLGQVGSAGMCGVASGLLQTLIQKHFSSLGSAFLLHPQFLVRVGLERMPASCHSFTALGRARRLALQLCLLPT